MSQEKVQLIAPEGTFTVPGLNVAGVVTGGNFVGDVTGAASSLAKGSNLVVGVLTASSFVGDVTGNVVGITSNTDNLILGEVTATSMVGDFTGIASGITGGPNITAGLVTATKFQGDTTGSSTGVSGGKNINVGTFTASSFAGDLTGNAAGLSTTTANLKLGITSATSFSGDLTGNATELAGSSANLKLGITSASSFAGDLTGNAANLAGSSARLKLGIVTATSFAGNLTGNAANLTGTNANLNLGIVTASSFAGNLTGNVASLSTNDANMRLGIVTASSFAGNLFGNAGSIASNNKNLKLGICSASSFAGDLTGNASAVSGTPNLKLGICSASSFAGNLTGNASAVSGTPNLKLGICTASSFAGNLTGNAAGLSNNTSHANLGIVTATTFLGDGSNLTGIAAGAFNQQSVTANSTSTVLNLSSGNIIFMTQSSNTTIAFNNPDNVSVAYLVRTKDDNGTARTITWPTGLTWDGGTEPTLLQKSGGATYKAQVFKLIAKLPSTTAITYAVTVANSGGNKFYLDGTVSYKATLYRGGVYTFDQSDSSNSGHPLRFSTVSDGTHGGGSQYTTGVVTNGTPGNAGAYTRITVADDAPLLYYYCSVHSGMGSYVEIGGWYAKEVVNKDGLVPHTLFVWGGNSHGELGLNSTTNDYTNVGGTQLPGTTWAQLGGGQHTPLAVKSDGTLWSWGRGHKGQLGQNHVNSRSSPIQIPGTTWRETGSIYGNGSSHSNAIKSDGTLWAWGENTMGVLGQNSRTSYSSPVQVGSSTNWQSASANGNMYQYATKTDGTFWSWGANYRGILGHSEGSVRYSSPTQLPGTNWGDPEAGKFAISQNYTAAAIKTDGTLWMWGENQHGSLGQNNHQEASGSRSSPIQVPGTTWKSIAFNSGSAVSATKTDGTLWGWGDNGNGDLGLNNKTTYSSPTQVPGTTWDRVWPAQSGSTRASKTDGTLWAWGSGSVGGWGPGKYSSPIQIGSDTNWRQQHIVGGFKSI
tara:strand:- start:5628 stop:8588 length:2961 start_codon:yes stop_codon:yes gene_type:complete